MAKKKQRINLIDRNGNSQVVQVNSSDLSDSTKSAKKVSAGSTIKNTVSGIIKGGNTKAISKDYGALSTVARTVTGGVSSAKDKQGHNLIDNTNQLRKNLVSGTFSGVTSIPDSELYEVRNSLEKGEKKAEETTGVRDTLKSILGTGKDALLSSNPVTAQFVKDDDSKGVEGALKGLKNVSDISGGKKGLYKSIEAFGEAYSDYKKAKGEEGKLSKKVEKLQEKIDKPSEEYAQKVQEENQNYNKVTQVLGENFQTVGNMAPSIAMSAVTKNPSAGMWALYQGAKGSGTKEALQKGADLDTATAIGNAKGLLEVGTEQLSGGIKIKGKSVYGQGALDDVIENNVNRLVKNKAANWLVKQFGTAPLGEIAEETISDLVGSFIDKNTVDPNAKYNLKDWAHTAGMTYLSTLTLNLLGGSFGKSSYNQNLQSIAETQVADIQNRVDRGLMSQEDGARAIEQITQELNDSIGTNEEISTPEEIQEALINTSPEDIQQAVVSATNAITSQVEQGKLNEQQGQRLLETIQENAQVLLEQQQQLTQSQNGQMQFNLDNQSTIEDKISLVQSLNDTEYAALSEITQKLKRGEQLNEQDRATLNYLNSKQNQNAQQEVVQEQPKLPTDTNDKVQNYRNSLENENVEDRDGFFKAFEKIIQDKDYNVVFDSSITNEQGNPVNAVITNENGITIRINPQSERASEILLMHEVTHGIETKEMRNLIMDYAKKNSEFNDALEDLKKAYGTEDVTPEVVADISGQLFGNQEFINNLAVEKPSLFKRILDAIKELKNRLTGNKDYNKFVRSLEVKWERAYRNANIESSQQNLREGAKYSQNAEMSNQVDNDGNQLSNDQVEFFDESKARDEDGNLVKVYHTMTDAGMPFYEFNPTGTEGYREEFDGQVVNFYTNSKDMSGSYAAQEYLKADTKRYTKVSEIQEFLDKLNEVVKRKDGALPWNVKKVVPSDHLKNAEYVIESGGNVVTFESQDDLFRNWKNKLAETLNKSSDIQGKKHNMAKWQYEGYLNIKNPYIVDVKGRMYHQAVLQVSQEKNNVIDKIERYKQELNKLANESTEKFQKYASNNGNNNYMLKSAANTFIDEVLYEVPEEKINDVLEDYEKFYNSAKDEGFDLPDPNQTLEDAFSEINYGIIEDLREDYDESFVDSMISQPVSSFLREYYDLNNAKDNYGTASAWFEKKFKDIVGDEINLGGIPGDVWYKISKEMFSQEARDMYAGEEYNTNDIVAYIIKKNKTLQNKYDGLIFKNIRDWAASDFLEAAVSEPADVYVTFASNQFKAADNLHPTEDPDIRYSKEADKWQKFLDKYFKSKGTTTKAKDYIKKVPKQGPALADVGKTQTRTVEQPSTNTQEFKEAQQKVKNGTATMKERQYIETATEAQNTKELAKDMDEVAKSYEVLANKTTMKRAENQLSGFDTVEDKAKYVSSLLTSGKRITAADITAAQLVLKDAAATKNAKLYTDVLADTSILATEYGQVIQALSQIKKLSPTSQLDMLDKIIKREKAKGNRAYDNLKITAEMRDRVLNCYDENGNINQEQFDETMNDIKQELADNMKTGWKEKVRAWRYLSMLGNPKTHVRNEVANVAMSAVKGIKDMASGLSQDIFIRNKRNKTRTLKIASKDVRKLSTTAYNEIKNENYGNKYNEQSDLESRKRVFRTGFLEAVRKFNDKALSAEDQGFKKINFKKSFANYLTAQGIKTEQDIKNNPGIIEEAKQFAVMEANVATFNQKNKLSEFINSADNKLGGYGKVIRGAIIPFTRTPLNIAKTGIEYTPGLGMLTTIEEVKNAPDNKKGAAFIDGISKQATGSALALIGYALAKAGYITAGSGDDKEDKFEIDQGSKMDYSIKLGDSSYDLSWLSPSSMPLFVGARMFEVLDKQEGINENLIVESLASTLDPLSEMSVIQSFTDVLSSYSQEGTGKIKDMAVSTMQNYLSQFVPTLSGQFARLFDDKKRTTMADTGAANKISQETIRRLQYKIPGARNLLPESTDYYGREKKEYNEGNFVGKSIGGGLMEKMFGEDANLANRIYNSFLSPVNKRKDTMTEEDKEIIRLYNKTGNDNIIPYSMAQNVKFNDNNYKMTRQEFNKYKKDFGDAYTENVKSLMKTYSYRTASDDEKAQMIAGIMSYAKDKTKDNFLTNKGENYVKISKTGEVSSYESDKVDSLTNNNFGIANYYIYKTYAPNVIDGKEKDVRNRLNTINTFGIDYKTYSKYMKEIGTIKGSDRKQRIFQYINNLDLTREQKQLLMKKTYKSYRNYDKQFYNKINNSDLTTEEKENLRSFLKIGE